MLEKNKKYIDTLVAMAVNQTAAGAAKIAAAVVHKGVMYFGANSKKSHPFQAKFGKNAHAIYLHAETSAIKNALRHLDLDELSRSTLYIARVKKRFPHDKKWVHGLAKPCDGCAKCIAEFNIKKVVYTEND